MGERAPSILIVDDEEMVVSSLRGFFTLSTNYEVLEATSPRQAIDELARTPVDVVISDFLMPEMNGIEMLKEARRLQPDAMCLLLTGYADKENAIKAINEVGLYHYLEKPWDNEVLLNIVKNALAEKSLRQQLAAKVRELDGLVSRHTELWSEHEGLKRELEIAARVQRSLLPKAFPSFEDYRFTNLYEPCEALGGDFVDVALDGDRAVVLLSDVTGHGVQAALTTMLLKGVFQEEATRPADPPDLLARMNRRLYRILPDAMYAAAAVFFVREGDEEIPFANAGLPYPFVLRRQGRLDEIVLPGPPLGLFDTELLPYDARAIETSEGDVVLAGSDGIGSISNDEGDFFEDRELRRTLAELAGRDGETVVETTFSRARAFGTGKPLPDDVNLVAITRT